MQTSTAYVRILHTYDSEGDGSGDGQEPAAVGVVGHGDPEPLDEPQLHLAHLDVGQRVRLPKPGVRAKVSVEVLLAPAEKNKLQRVLKRHPQDSGPPTHNHLVTYPSNGEFRHANTRFTACDRIPGR